MVDTNIFNRLIDGRLDERALPTGKYISTEIQRLELEKTNSARDSERRQKLLDKFSSIVDEVIEPEGFSFDIPGVGWDQAKFASDKFEVLVNKMKDRLSELDKKGKTFVNQYNDVLIAANALSIGAVLLSCDRRLIELMRENGGLAVNPDES